MSGNNIVDTPREEPYSLVSHLGQSIYLGFDWRERVWLMLAAYYDESGGTDQPATVVAGYVSTVDRWIDFDRAWKACLQKFGVPYFHMRKFAHFRRPFETGWQGEHRKRREFLSELIEIIQIHAFRGFACAIETDVFKEFVSIPGVLDLYPTAYAYCGRSVVGKAKMWALGKFRLPMQSFFEYREDNWGDLERILVRDGHPVPVRKPKLPRTPAEALDCLTPLQAADFAAYELLKAHKLLSKGENLVYDDFRESFKALERAVPSEWGVSTAKDLSQFLDVLRLAQASGKAFRIEDRP